MQKPTLYILGFFLSAIFSTLSSTLAYYINHCYDMLLEKKDTDILLHNVLIACYVLSSGLAVLFFLALFSFAILFYDAYIKTSQVRAELRIREESQIFLEE